MSCLSVSGSYAEDTGKPMFSFSGFGTLGAVHADADDADFTGNPFQPRGAGYSRPWAASVDSKLGVQMDTRFTDELSAVVQVVSQYRYDSTYTPQIEWANVKYQFTPDFSVRAGRTVVFPFMLSDTRLVGYTYPWIRPPQELYRMFSLTNLDGIDASYRFYSGAWINSVSATYGRTTLKTVNDGEFKAKYAIEVSNTLEVGPSTFRISYSSVQADIRIPSIDALFAGFTQFGTAASASGFPATGAQALALGDKYRLHDFQHSFIAVGMYYDPGDWLLMAEWAAVKSSAASSDAIAWHITGGYRFGKLTPYVTVAQINSDRITEPGISTAGLPPSLANAATDLNTGLDRLIKEFAWSQKSVSIGTRWDFMRNTAFKLQYDRVELGSFSSGWLGNVQPGFQPGGKVDVFSLAVDFVF